MLVQMLIGPFYCCSDLWFGPHLVVQMLIGLFYGCSDLLRLDNTNADAIYVRGMCLYYEDNIDKAFQHFQQVLKLAPDHSKAMTIYRVSIDYKWVIGYDTMILKQNITSNDLNKSTRICEFQFVTFCGYYIFGYGIS